MLKHNCGTGTAYDYFVATTKIRLLTEPSLAMSASQFVFELKIVPSRIRGLSRDCRCANRKKLAKCVRISDRQPRAR